MYKSYIYIYPSDPVGIYSIAYLFKIPDLLVLILLQSAVELRLQCCARFRRQWIHRPSSSTCRQTLSIDSVLVEVRLVHEIVGKLLLVILILGVICETHFPLFPICIGNMQCLFTVN